MDMKVTSKRISDIKDEIVRLKNIVTSMEITDMRRYPDNYEELSTEAALRSEKITCRLRELIYATTTVKKSELMEKAAEAHGIEIEEKDGILKVTLPALLPKRKQRKNMEFLIDPLFFALNRYADGNRIKKFNECVVCFSHIYDKATPERQIRDYDNLELKQFLDVVSLFFMVDDNGLLCDMYNTTELGDKDYTCLRVMTKQQFPQWLQEHENGRNPISEI